MAIAVVARVETLDDVAPFNSLDAALRFAYRIEWESTYPTSQLGKLHIKWKPEYTMADRHAQASLILVHVARSCSPVQRAFIECQHRVGRRRFSHINYIVNYIIPTISGPSASRRLVRELVFRYFRDGLTYKQIAQLCECDPGTVAKYNDKVWPCMLALNAQVGGPLSADFRACGLICD